MCSHPKNTVFIHLDYHDDRENTTTGNVVEHLQAHNTRTSAEMVLISKSLEPNLVAERRPPSKPPDDGIATVNMQSLMSHRAERSTLRKQAD